MLEGKSMPSTMAAKFFVEKSKCHKLSPLNAFLLKFRVWDNFYVFSRFLAAAIRLCDLLVQVAY